MYDAFISYSHAKDRALAAGLQSVIQTLGKPWWKRRASRIFRDDTSLSAAPGLVSALERALCASRYLILLASPRSACSKWVEREVETWLATKSTDTLLIALTEGDLAWDDQSGDFDWGPETPLPKVLRGRLEHEPLWVDLRPFQEGGQRIGRGDQAFLAASAALAAPIRGVAREDLLSEEVTQQRRNLFWARGAAAVLATLAALAVWEAVQATRARNIAEEQRDRAQRVLDQVISTANGRVFALAERARNQTKARGEIAEIASSDASSRPPQGGSPFELDRANELVALSARYRADEDVVASLKAAETALGLIDSASVSQRGGTFALLTKSKAFEEIGLAYARLGQIEEASSSLAESLETIKASPIGTPKDPELRDQTATALQNLGDVYRETGKLEDAERLYREAFDLRTRAADLQPSSLAAIQLLGAANNRIANLQIERNNNELALKTIEFSVSILKPSNAETSDDRAVERELAIAYELRSDALSALKRLDEALAWLEADLAITRALVDTVPSEALWQHDLATTYAKLGRLLERLGRDGSALEAYDKAIAVEAMLMARNHRRAEWLRDAAATLELRGILLVRLGRIDDAVSAFRRGLAMREQIAASSPEVRWQRELESAYRRTREVLLKSDHPITALETAEQQLFATSLAVDDEPGKNERVARALGALGWTALFAHSIPRAVWAGEQAVQLAPDLRFAKLNYAHALMFSGNLAAAKRIYLEGASDGGAASKQWRDMIKKDFTDLSTRKLYHPLMTEIEREIGQ